MEIPADKARSETQAPCGFHKEQRKVTATVWHKDADHAELVRLQPGFHDALYGVAVDVGTTTVAAHLCHLRTGEILATASMMNPQVPYGEDLMSYLFGNILLVSTGDLYLVAALDVFVLVLGLVFYNRFLAVCYDAEFARLRGVNVEFYYLLLLSLVALTVVVLVTVVGLVLVIALLTLPAAIASHFMSRLWQVMLVAIVISMLSTVAGLALSYGPQLPPGATTIAICAGAYLITILGKKVVAPRKNVMN